MPKYLVTISWQDNEQSLIRNKCTDTIELDNIATLFGWKIVEEIKASFFTRYSEKDIAIDFMMKISDGEE